MTVIEYTKLKNEFLPTDYTGSGNDTVSFVFLGARDGTLYIGENSFKLENGIATVKINALSDGTYTPVLNTNEGSLICGKIKLAAGVLTSHVCITESALRLTKEIIAADAKADELERKISELSSAVYGKSIL